MICKRRKRHSCRFIAPITAALLTALGTVLLAGCANLPDTAGTGVIVGSGGWLFAEEDELGSELDAYTGKSLFTDEQLDSILATIKAKRTFFAKTNTDLIVVIVPDKMNVYSDMLPDEIRAGRAENTRIKQVRDTIRNNTRVSVVDMSELFAMNCQAFDLYDRTGTHLSDIGAYLTYTEIMKAVYKLHLSDFYVAALDSFSMNIADDSGLELARRINAEERFGNHTISLTYTGQLPYHSVEYTRADNVSVTEIPEEKRMEGYRYVPLMFYGSTGMLEAVSPFAALSFRQLACTNGFVTDGKVTADLRPAQAVFLLYERELEQLIENQVTNTEYLEKNNNTPYTTTPSGVVIEEVADDDPTRWPAPEVKGIAFADANRFVVTGIASEGTVVHIYGGLEEVSCQVIDGMFLAEVPVSGAPDLALTVSGYGRTDSRERVIHLGNSGLSTGYKSVITGRDGRLHIDATMADYLGTNAYSSGEAKRRVANMERLQRRIREVSPESRLLYLIAPNHSTVYPESMPDWVAEQKKQGVLSKLDQLTAAAKDADILFVNPTEALLARKDNPYGMTLYNRTDTHWNELGAYYAAEYLINHFIAPEFTEAAITPLSEFDVYTRSAPGGDMLNYLGMNLEECRENVVFVRRKAGISPITGYDKPFTLNFDNQWTSARHTFSVDNDALPTMMMYRDSFSSNLIDFLADSFSRSTFTEMWNFTVNLEEVANLKPDYVIIEVVERNIDNIGN